MLIQVLIKEMCKTLETQMRVDEICIGQPVS